jgi:hypothetical protein
MQEPVNQLLFPHIRVNEVLGYVPGQGVHAVESKAVLDRHLFKESFSEHLPYLNHPVAPIYLVP